MHNLWKEVQENHCLNNDRNDISNLFLVLNQYINHTLCKYAGFFTLFNIFYIALIFCHIFFIFKQQLLKYMVY